ncbi:MAG: OsmC family protein [Chloroflexi bacterium]|nr:OsmC family protein [Chloroflexota bacterium]
MREKRVEVVHDGGMAFAARMSSGHTFRFDDRTSNTGASPVETVLAALAACSAMDVAGIALKKRQRIGRYAIRVTGTQREAYPQVFPRIDVVHEFAGDDLSEAAIRRSIELSAEKYCPVSAMLSAGATEIHHRFVIRSGGRAPYESQGEVAVTGPYKRPEVVG